MSGMSATSFAASRGQNVIRLSQVNSSSRELGHFYCEVPDANDINQVLYISICELQTCTAIDLPHTYDSVSFFCYTVDIGVVTIAPSGPINKSAGEIFILECSIDISPYPLPQHIPSLILDWFFGPTNTSLPPGVAVSDMESANYTHSRTLQFFPLLESHAGMYTCQLGNNNSLADSIIISTCIHIYPYDCSILYLNYTLIQSLCRS